MINRGLGIGPARSDVMPVDSLVSGAVDDALSRGWVPTSTAELGNMLSTFAGAAVQGARDAPGVKVFADAVQFGNTLAYDPDEVTAESLFDQSKGKFADLPDEEVNARLRSFGAITKEEYEASEHFRDDMPWNPRMTMGTAEAMAEFSDLRRARQYYAEKRPITAFIGGIAGSAVDPINYVPIAGPVVKAAAIAKAGKIAGTAAVASLDAAANTAVFGAATLELRQQYDSTVTVESLVSDVAMAALAGSVVGGIGGGVGAFKDARSAAAIADRIGTLKRAQESRVVLNDAAASLALDGEVKLSPASKAFIEKNSAAVRRAATITDAERAAVSVIAGTDGPLVGIAPSGMRPHRVTAGDSMSIEVAPIVVEADDLITSADAGYDAMLQPRDRSRAASTVQITDIAGGLDPERLGMSAEADRGAPIVGADRMVESGNGRVAAIRQVYRQGGERAQAYREWVASQGVDVTGFRNPVLVRQRMGNLTGDQRQAFAMAANRSATLTFSAPERARSDAKLISPGMLGQIENVDDLGAAANARFVRSFVGALPPAEAGAMVTADGRLSAEGLSRVRNAILGKAYDDAAILSRMTESSADDIRSLTNALVALAPEWASLRTDVATGRVPADLDMTADLLDAVKRTADLRAKGVKLDDFLAQQDAFDRISPRVEGLMRLFYQPGGRRAAGRDAIISSLKSIVEEARKVTTDEGLGFGFERVTADDLINLANAKRGNVAPATGSEATALAKRFDDRPDLTVDELHARAVKHAPALAEAGRSIAARLGLTFKDGGTKELDGLHEKMARKGYEKANEITDAVRGGFIVPSPADADRVVALLAERFDVKDEGWMTTDAGYVDRKVLVRFDDGVVGEMQLWEPNILKAKEEGGGHKLYEKRRDLAKDDPRRASLIKKERALYSAALDKAGDDWSSSRLGGSKGPNFFSKRARQSSSVMSPAVSDTSSASTSVQSRPGYSTANAVVESSDNTAGRASQFTNFMGGTSNPNIGASDDAVNAGQGGLFDGGEARHWFDDPRRDADLDAAREALPKPEAKPSDAYAVNPDTGDVPEQTDFLQLVAEGLVRDDELALVNQADDVINSGRAYADAVEKAVGCLI